MAKPSHGRAQREVTEYFSGLASVYAGFRPTYPAAAIEWVLEGCARPARVADVGCGTGISSRLMAEQGARVIGIEPNEDMRRQAGQEPSPTQGRVEYRAGTAEHTGLKDGSMDLVVCAQSFHWFDAERALREFHRILKRGGRLGLMWNIKDESVGFSTEFSRLAVRAQADAAMRGLNVPSERDADPTLGGFFGGVRTREFENPQSLNLDGVLGRLRSASYFPKGGPVRDELEAGLRQAFVDHERGGQVVLMHRAEVTIAARLNQR
ncbi:MAG: class I SAM-dependent methyltransferase [Phycisphaerales bacterium]|nr:class I SAM-dependent methyltransferase [Phycisphaerales bacterium]MCI0631289.1 class I SAM-dependent methyltransferase [Phycisphaerales bacterium]MCI0676997.1 class I SAM-dependent methyltransferase [Phycisphaerales bacterium]